MSIQAVRDRYGVPAKVGAKVQYQGLDAWITSAPGHHLRLLVSGDNGSTGPYHPLWKIDYLDGIDHGARYDARVERFNEGLGKAAHVLGHRAPALGTTIPNPNPTPAATPTHTP